MTPTEKFRNAYSLSRMQVVDLLRQRFQVAFFETKTRRELALLKKLYRRIGLNREPHFLDQERKSA